MHALVRSFHATLRRHPEIAGSRRYVVAFSGGLDSTVLLDLARRVLPQRPAVTLRAVHVDHRLHPDSAGWAERCIALAERFGVAATVRVVPAGGQPGDSPEAAARAARYAALTAELEPDDVLLTAHHRDDQLETVLLQLLRGAGVAGLAGMPALRPRGPGWQLRPLLDVDRQALTAYADGCGLAWLDDPGNADLRFDRNFLRHEIVPVLRRRWPAAAAAAARSARHCGEAAELLRALGDTERRALAAAGDTLQVSGLRALPQPRQRYALRAWFAAAGVAAPRATHLEQVMQLLTARAGGGCVGWAAVEVRRFRDRLYLLPRLAAAPGSLELSLRADETVQLPADLGTLSLRSGTRGGLDPARLDAPLVVRWRAGGERIRPHGAAHRRALRKLYQESGVVPWMRDRIPLIYAGARLAAVADLWLAHDLVAGDDVAGLHPSWDNRPRLY